MMSFKILLNITDPVKGIAWKAQRKGIFTILSMIILMGHLLLYIPQSDVSAQQQPLPVYVVKSGDTLYSIALQFNLTLEEVVAANSEINPDFLNIGDRIIIPGLEGITGVLTNQQVNFGENLISLSRRNQTDPVHIIKLNKITSPSEAFAGIEWIVPISEDPEILSPISKPSQDITSLELTALNNTNTWRLKQTNAITSTFGFLPDEVLWSKSETETASSLPIPHITSFEIDSLPLVQGATLTIEVGTDSPLEINANINDIPINFFADEENQYAALYGVSAIAEPGVYPMTVELSSEPDQIYRFTQWILLEEAGFVSDPEIYVPTESVDPANIAAEESIFDSYIKQLTPVRYWDDMFWPPVADRTNIVGYYGNRRSYNDGALLYYHTGVDFGYALGIDVFAPAKGIVIATEPDLFIRGNALIIDHGWGVFTGYWHLSEFLVEVGDLVEPGQLIARLGNTGRSAGPHLHFEVIVNKVAVNPLTWLTKEFP